MNTWYTADWHLGENRFEIMQRPFTDQMEMIDVLVANHNKVVAPEDRVIMVGDVVYQKTPEFLTHVARFNGHKTLYRGNHDVVFTDEQLKPYFDTIISEGAGEEHLIEGIPCWITHYPTRGRKDLFNIVGHIHSAWKYQLNMFNVGVDVNHYRPVNGKQIKFAYDAVCQFYDDDVWVAYQQANQEYVGKRGKSGSYFKG